MVNRKYIEHRGKKSLRLRTCVCGGSCMEGGNVKPEKNVKFYSRLGRKTDAEHA